MVDSLPNIQRIPVSRIFLDLENPRHEPYKNEQEVIEYLCRQEYIYELAKDIASHTLNPLEVFALIPSGKKEKSGQPASYMVVEGNRRMCALKLLDDPDLAPANQRKDFASLAKDSQKIPNVYAVIFDDKSEVGIWLPRIHGGLQGGIGRKPWDAEQKTRYFGDKKNILAQFILDYAEKHNFISATDRRGKLTTAQRYLGNGFLREAMGIDHTDLDNISRTRPKNDFDLLLKQFMSDLLKGVVNSRANADDIKKYSRALSSIKGISGERNEPVSLSATEHHKIAENNKRKSPKEPKKPTHIAYEEEIAKKLADIPSYKLQRIYYSLCEIGLEEHTPLVSVGAWSFFECLTARAGRASETTFYDYLSKQKLNNIGYTEREDVNSIRQAVQRIANYGNNTKHHDESANFNGEQLVNDMNILKEVICKLADEAKEAGKKTAA